MSSGEAELKAVDRTWELLISSHKLLVDVLGAIAIETTEIQSIYSSYNKATIFTVNQRLFSNSYNILSSHIHNILTTTGHTSECDMCHVISDIMY